MKVMAQIAMVMNLDKCIGCHTCSVTCKQVWTNREGTEYIWFNNVETRPGVGYPRGWEDQKKWKGGWKRTATGRLVPRQGGRVASLAKIFANPTQPTMKDYYEPWTYEYDKLLQAPANSRAIPTARAKSTITGEHIDKPEWGPNWDDDLGGSMETLDQDPVLHQMNLQVAKTIEDAYMFYLPRICEHCLNPTCVSACPSGAMYKRTEDGIVLVDQDQCRGWRMCVSACPRGVLELVPRRHRVAVFCNTRDKLRAVTEVCDAGCINCGRCAKACPAKAVSNVAGRMVVDQIKCVSYGPDCGEACVEACARHILRRTCPTGIEAANVARMKDDSDGDGAAGGGTVPVTGKNDRPAQENCNA